MKRFADKLKVLKTKLYECKSLAKLSNEGGEKTAGDRKPRYIVACATLSLIVTVMIFVLGIVTTSYQHLAYLQSSAA